MCVCMWCVCWVGPCISNLDIALVKHISCNLYSLAANMVLTLATTVTA